jgi:hypothetical protein
MEKCICFLKNLDEMSMNENEIENMSKDTEKQISKAGKLAMELSQEKKRLKKDLADLQTEVEVLTPTTPTGTVDWYVKWTSMSFAVLGVFLMSAGLVFYGQIAYILSAIGWVYVGMAWGDRAIMIGSAITGTAVMMNFVQGILTS